MSYIEKVFREALEKYPEMEVQDALKLIYQSEFGPGHLIKNKEASYHRLLEEWNNTQEDNQELFEHLGGGYVRFNISAAKKSGISPELFQKIFFVSAQVQHGTLEGFYGRVNELKELSAEGSLPFSDEEIELFISKWEEEGRPLFRHSQGYRELYNPAYGVVEEKYINLLPLLMKLQQELQKQERIIIAIDGPCGSGKTTLANELAKLYSAPVIHMDDFFLPPPLRSQERLAEPGGNIHYERFLEEIAGKVKENDVLKYRVFSCRIMDYKGEAEIPQNNLIIVEGSYSMHPLYSSIYDVKVFCQVEPQVQRERIIKRNGIEMYKNFEAKWIPMEHRYFEEFKIKEQCDLVV